jgi:glycerol-3-phosphate dehydrogenase (NAD(P)+)
MADRVRVERIAVLGAGAWGTALAGLAASAGHPTVLWARDPGLAAAARATRRNEAYLPGCRLPEALRITADLGEAAAAAGLIILAVPSHGLRAVAAAARAALPAEAVLVSAAKGFEAGSGLTMSAVLAEAAGAGRPVAVLSGPSFAAEVARGAPTAAVVAAADIRAAERVQRALGGPTFRTYASRDVLGVELAGGFKNVVAIAAGIADGLGLGPNARAALIARGLAEVTRLGLAAGAKAATFAGLAGLGDLVLTCTSPLSRNYSLGAAVGQGLPLDRSLAGRRTVAEGVNAAREAARWSARHGVEMPICDEVRRVLFEGRPPRAAIEALMARPLRAEDA